MSEFGIEKGGSGESEADYRNFLGTFEIDNPNGLDKPDTPAENSERRDGIKHLATTALDLPKGSSWADLAKAGGYSAYLQKVEQITAYRDSLDAGEKYAYAWAKENKVSLTTVSGLTIFRGQGESGGPLVNEVLLSVTDPEKKAWTHQPFGGKRNAGEGAVAAMLREFGEEAGWGLAVQLIHSFKDKSAFYTGYYVSEPRNGKALFIQCFSMNGKNFDAEKISSGSDSLDYIWAGRNLLEGEAGERMTLTQQAEHYMSIFGFERPRSKFTHPDEGYYGVPGKRYDKSEDGPDALPSGT